MCNNCESEKVQSKGLCPKCYMRDYRARTADRKRPKLDEIEAHTTKNYGIGWFVGASRLPLLRSQFNIAK